MKPNNYFTEELKSRRNDDCKGRGTRWKSKNNVNRFEVLRDDDDVIERHT